MLSRYNVSSSLFPLWATPSVQGFDMGQMMNRLFDDFEVALETVRPRIFGQGRVQMHDTGDAVQLAVDLPGCRQEDIDLSIEGATLSLSAAAPNITVPEGFKLIHRERQPAALQWSVELPDPVQVDAVGATFQQGRLLVTLPKAAAAKPRAIPVTTA
jgi:HSP20 family protein